MKKLLLLFSAVLIAIFGMQAQSSYTIEFASTSNSQTEIKTDIQAKTFITSSSLQYVEENPVKSATMARYGGNDTPQKSSILFGSKKNSGSITLKLSDLGKVKATKITISAQKYNNDNNTSVSVCGKNCTVTATSFTDYSVDLDGSNILSELTIETSGKDQNRVYIKSITVTYKGDATLGELSATYNSDAIAKDESVTVEYGSSISFSANYATSFEVTTEGTTTTIDATNGSATWTPAVCENAAVSVVAKREVEGEDVQTSEPLTFNLTVVKPNYLIANWIVTGAGNADDGTVDLDLKLSETSSPGKWHAYGTGTYSGSLNGGAQLGAKDKPFKNGTITLTHSEIPANAIIQEITFNGYTKKSKTIVSSVTVNGESAGNISINDNAAKDYTLSGLALEGNEIIFTVTSTPNDAYLCVKGISIKYIEKQPGEIELAYDEHFSEGLSSDGIIWHMAGNKLTFTSEDAAKMTIACEDASISVPEAANGSSITWQIPEGLDATAVTVTGSSKSGLFTSTKTYKFTSELKEPMKPYHFFGVNKNVVISTGGNGTLMIRTYPYDPYAEEDIAPQSIETQAEWYYTPQHYQHQLIYGDTPVIMTIQAKSVTPLAESEVLTFYVDGNGNVSGIENIATDGIDAEAIYYNLQGQRVNADQPGLYIRQQNGKAKKIIIR